MYTHLSDTDSSQSINEHYFPTACMHGSLYCGELYTLWLQSDLVQMYVHWKKHVKEQTYRVHVQGAHWQESG